MLLKYHCGFAGAMLVGILLVAGGASYVAIHNAQYDGETTANVTTHTLYNKFKCVHTYVFTLGSSSSLPTMYVGQYMTDDACIRPSAVAVRFNTANPNKNVAKFSIWHVLPLVVRIAISIIVLGSVITCITAIFWVYMSRLGVCLRCRKSDKDATTSGRRTEAA